MKRTLLLILVFLTLFLLEIGKVYFIMPFPGSQRSNTIDIAYFLHNNIWWLRLIMLALLLYLLWPVFSKGKLWKKITNTLFLVLYIIVVYLFNFRFLADKMFYQPKQKIFATVAANTVDTNRLVLGVAINNEAKAYPIEIIGYHHQVRDTVGGQPVMVTYCTVCRTGRVYDPKVDGQPESFRLVGMDHFNAMFEDATTKSWWRQVTGEAITGKRKGKTLPVIASQQMRLAAWLRLHPGSLIMQPDNNFTKQYQGLAGFDNGTIKSDLEQRDSGSWKMKSWVVGVLYGSQAKAYDWNDLVRQRIINDTIGGRAVLLTLENDKESFHAFQRTALAVEPFHFEADSSGNFMKEKVSATLWTLDGTCIEGMYKGQRLVALPAYQEFWHSWQTFHSNTTAYKGK